MIQLTHCGSYHIHAISLSLQLSEHCQANIVSWLAVSCVIAWLPRQQFFSSVLLFISVVSLEVNWLVVYLIKAVLIRVLLSQVEWIYCQW